MLETNLEDLVWKLREKSHSGLSYFLDKDSNKTAISR